LTGDRGSGSTRADAVQVHLSGPEEPLTTECWIKSSDPAVKEEDFVVYVSRPLRLGHHYKLRIDFCKTIPLTPDDLFIQGAPPVVAKIIRYAEADSSPTRDLSDKLDVAATLAVSEELNTRFAEAQLIERLPGHGCAVVRG